MMIVESVLDHLVGHVMRCENGDISTPDLRLLPVERAALSSSLVKGIYS
jgi:hypothetical protein